MSDLWENFKRELNLEYQRQEDLIYREFFAAAPWYRWINPLIWIDYSFAVINKWESAPIIAALRTMADGLYSKKGTKEAFKKANTRVMSGAKAFTLAEDVIITGAITALNYDASTVVGLAASFVGRWLWKTWNKASTIQVIKFWIRVIKMPDTEAALIAILEKRLLSVKGLWTVLIAAIFITFKFAVAVFAASNLLALYAGLTDTSKTSLFQSRYFSQSNKLVKDRSLGWRRQRK